MASQPGESKRANHDVHRCRAVDKGIALLVSFVLSALETSGDVTDPMTQAYAQSTFVFTGPVETVPWDLKSPP